MMQNQYSQEDALRLREEFKTMPEVLAAMDSGRNDVADAVIAQVFADYEEQVQEPVYEEPQSQEQPEEVYQEPVVEQQVYEEPVEVSETPVEAPTIEDNTEEVVSGVDPELKRKREAYRAQQELKNELKNEFKTQLTEVNIQLETVKSAAQQREQELLRQLEAVKSQIVDPESDTDVLEIGQNIGVDTPTEDGMVVDPRLDKLQSEFDAYRQQQEEFAQKQRQREAYEDAVQRYRDFWMSDKGESLKPTGNVKKNIDGFLDFFSDLSNKVGSEDYANIMMQDIAFANDGEAIADVEKLGLSIPEGFDKIYKTYVLDLATEGKEIDPVTGETKQTSKRRLGSIEEAYILQNPDAVQDKNAATENIRRKLAEKTNSARQIDPSKYAPMPTSSVWSDSNAQMDLLKKAGKAGYDGRSIASCKDENLQTQLREMYDYTGLRRL